MREEDNWMIVYIPAHAQVSVRPGGRPREAEDTPGENIYIL